MYNLKIIIEERMLLFINFMDYYIMKIGNFEEVLKRNLELKKRNSNKLQYKSWKNEWC